MRMRVVRRSTLVLLATVGLAACQRSDEGAPGTVGSFADGGLHVEVSTPAGDVREGANELRIAVRDAAGAPVNDARVSVQYSMSMAGSPSMGGRVVAEPMGDGQYRAEATLEMGGTWQVVISAERASGGSANAQGTMRTGAPGVRIGPSAAPVTESETKAGTVRMDPQRLQKIGVRFAEVERAPLTRSVRALGRVTWDETKLVDVALKVRGFVRELRADALGARVEKGEPLFFVYSPELYAAQNEYLQALRSKNEAVRVAARARLRLWDIADGDIAALEKRAAPFEMLAVRSPSSGVLVEKNVVQGAAFEAGARLFRIAPLEHMWVEAEIYASDLAFVSVGQSATISAPYLQGTLEGRVAYVLPALASETRTARVRLEIENGDLALRPEMFVDVALHADLGERVLVPASAVIVAGDRRVVFVDLGSGVLEPRTIKIGVANEEKVEVLEGLEPGERVVASGNFLISAESRIQSALEQW